MAERVGGALRLKAVDPRAAAAGCLVGAPLAQARAVRPDLAVALDDPAEDARLLEALADWCGRYTPLVALDPPDGLLLDVSGCAQLFGGEAALLAELTGALQARGLTGLAAIAGAAGTARALARHGGGGIAPSGAEAGLVSRLPVSALELDEPTRLGLVRAGLKTVGEAARRGRGELTARFGARLAAALDVALGVIDPPISPRRPAPAFAAERRFSEPISSADAVLACLRALADALGRRLEAAGRGATLVEAALFRVDGAVARLSVATGRPNRDPDMLLRLLREKLDALADPLDPGFGFDMARLSAVTVEPLDYASGGFDPGGEAEAAAAVAELVDRLSARHGRRRVLRYAHVEAHRPEAEARACPAQESGEPFWPARALGSEPPRRPLRLFAVPEPIEVRMAEAPDGPPARFLWRRVERRVRRAEGPERIAPEWWRDGGVRPTRDYFRVEDEDGTRFWIFRNGLFVADAPAPGWFLHGLFA